MSASGPIASGRIVRVGRRKRIKADIARFLGRTSLVNDSDVSLVGFAEESERKAYVADPDGGGRLPIARVLSGIRIIQARSQLVRREAAMHSEVRSAQERPTMSKSGLTA